MIRGTCIAIASVLAAAPLLAEVYSPAPADRITADGTGLHLTDVDGAAGRDLPFGTPFHIVIHTLVGIVGHEVHVAFPVECPEGPLVTVSLPGRIDLNFREDRFDGWFIGPGDSVVTPGGLGVGSLPGALETGGLVWRPESTLGTEFERDGIGGLVSDDGKTVTHLWAGTACLFR